MVDPAVSAAILTITFAVFSGLVGLAYRSLRNRVSSLESLADSDDDRHQNLVRRVDTIWRFLFGVEDNEEDAGLSGEIREGFENIEDEIEETKKKQEEYHTREMDAIENLANELHDEESVDINRDDVLDD